jgi:hypothetical protein
MDPFNLAQEKTPQNSFWVHCKIETKYLLLSYGELFIKLEAHQDQKLLHHGAMIGACLSKAILKIMNMGLNAVQ